MTRQFLILFLQNINAPVFVPNVNAAAFVPTFAVPPPALPATPSEPQEQQQEQQQPQELSPKKEQAAAAPSPSKNFLKISRFG